MYVHVKPTTKQRILAFFMAFAIIFVSLPYVGWTGTEVDAAQQITEVTKSGEFLQKYTVESTSHDGHSVVKASASSPNDSHTFTYRYTGAVKTTKVSLYDYKSDSEIPTGSPNNIYTNWGCEPFNAFNTAISNTVKDTAVSQNQNNITIRFSVASDISWWNSTNVYVYLYDDYDHNSGSHLDSKFQMTYNSTKQDFYITFNLVDSNAGNYLDFIPTHLYFYNQYYPGSEENNRTTELHATLIQGYTYEFEAQKETDSRKYCKAKRKNKTTIIFNDVNKIITDTDNAYIYMWDKDKPNGDSTGRNNTWPGQKMTYIGNNKYQLDFYGDYGNKKNFDPYKFILTKGDDNKWISSDLCFERVLKYGWTYEFKCEADGDTYKTTVYSATNPTTKALYTDAKVCKYDNPLYFGCYYRTTQIAGTYADDFKPDGVSTYTGDSTINFGGPYRNFWWQANLGMKSTGDGTGSNSVDVRGHAAVQGLVNTTLKTERKYTDTAYNATTNPNVLKLTQGSSEVELPYFSYQFQKDNPTLMTIYDNSGNGVDFPFYEILADAKNVRGDVTTGTDTARFYQFCSEDVNLRFDTSSQQFLEETNTRIKSNNSKTGYFPFNDSSSTAPSEHNLGFGTKFEMKFKLSSNGTVKTLDANGEETTNGNIHTMFEFFGDDDLWVFLDGNLLLDLGGTHDQTSGLIDFYEKKAYANKALTLGDGESKDDLGASVGIKTVDPTDFVTKLGTGSYNSDNGTYNEYYTHTMTIFYLERGMMDSNLMVRFNYKPESNFSKMKVQEITDFSGINAGLQDLTKKAADSDVFQYTLSNKDTKASDTFFTGILYPTYDTYQRKYKEDAGSTMIDQLTGQTLQYETTEQTDETAVFLDVSTYWYADTPVFGAWIWKDSEGFDSGKLYIGTKVPNTTNVYKFKGYSSDMDKICFLRFDPSKGPYYSGDVGWDNIKDKRWSRASEKSLISGRLYSVTDWSSVSNPGDSNYSFKVLKYDRDDQAKFNPPDNSQFNAVTNTNYIWVDGFAKLVGTEVDDIIGFTGRTDGSGNLNLMYGSGSVISETVDGKTKLKVSGVESSAEFENQFKRDSTMKVIQNDTLHSPARNSDTETFSDTLNRSVDTYYTTEVYAFDRSGEAFKSPSRASDEAYVLKQSQNATTKNMETEFKFNNNPAMALDDTMTVMMTEVFKNTPNKGNISVTKEINPTEGDNSTKTNAQFKYQLTLTNVFGINNVNASGTDYAAIVATKNGTTQAGYIDSSGYFYLKAGETITINDIPVGTNYQIEEIGQTGDNPYYEFSSVSDRTSSSAQWSTLGSSATVSNSIVTDQTHEYKYANKRKVGDLTLSKVLRGASSAGSSIPDSATPFTLHVELTADTGVNLKNYLGATPTFDPATTVYDISTSGAGYSDSDTKYKFDVTVKPTDANKVILKNIPYGTSYTVEEVITSDSNHPTPKYTYTTEGSGTQYASKIENENTVTTVTNVYRKITMTKKDNKDTDKTLSGAKFVLVKLKEDTALSNGVLTQGAIAAFNTATESNYTTSISAYIDDYSGVLTTNDSGIVEVKASMMPNALAGGKYFFVELSPPANYSENNESSVTYGSSSESQDKILTIPDSIPSNDIETLHQIYYYNERKTGKLVLNKARAAGSSGSQDFTFNVTLDGTDDSLKLSLYGITGFTSVNYNDTNHTATGTVTVAADGSATLSNIPFGTTYTVDETPVSGWVKVGTEYSDDTKKKIDTEPETNDTVTITNAKTGSLTINKTVEAAAGATLPDTIPTFRFTVNFTNLPGSLQQFGEYGIKLNDTLQTSNDFTVEISGLTSSSTSGSASITGIPYGTEYTVTEGDVENWTQTVPTNNGNYTGSISSSPSQANFTNQYTFIPPAPTYKSITLTKTDLNGNPLSGVTFALLKLDSSADTGNSTVTDAFAASNSGDHSSLSSYYDVAYGPKTTDASGRVTFTEGQDDITTFATGDRYFFYEVSATDPSINIDNSLTAEKIITISDDTSYNTTYKNSKTLSSVDVTVKKVDESDPTKGLEDAEFELWYKDSTVHPTYTFNDPITAPLKTNALKVSGTGITVPAAAEPESYTTYDYTYTYAYPSTPLATETEWILPRTDNDYIYFRDFESGTADHDPGLSGHAWLNTSFETNTYSQEQEIKYDHRYWVAAQFTKNGSDFVEYAVWERFVDRYSGFDTVVWKIQPPDGYNKVRFCLYDGSNCIRTTEEFNYELGKIYKKTSWGGIYSNGNYYNVPVNDENPDSWSTYYATSSSDNSKDKRLTGSNSSMYQAERYTPTEQKIIFHCNSQQVWHNIHIEFFGSDGTTTVGQKFPGYMMEPYAYAGSDYRLSNGYLTYELTIPDDAYYFRINNGVEINGGSPYAFYTEKEQIIRSGNTKNYGNYFILGTDINTRYDCLNNGSPRVATLTPAQAAITGLSYESTSASYSSNEVESDSDYIYFAKKKTSSWNNHIYAYFYGGGNLREDNWQRACYSIWPGVAPVGTQFSTSDGSTNSGSSTIYTYTPSANPESTFTIKKGTVEYTVYKFRMPEGDRKNYSKVIFNDGLNKINSGSAHETSPITYNAGYIYFEDGGSMQHFDNYSTTQYTKRSGADDYLYIKTSDTSWDDMHITFYRSDGSQIYQGGTGYVMKYAGTIGTEKYYRIPIPADAAKFKLNNGRDKESTTNPSRNLETDFGDILRKSDGTGEGNNTDYTKGKIVYTLTNPNTLTMLSLFNKTQTGSHTYSTVQDSKVDYAHTRGDYLYIRNTASWNIGAGGGQVKFYDSTDALITGNTTGGNGTYILIQTVNDDGDPAKEWYSIDIPDDAVSFTLTYNGGANTTARNPIYPKSADGTVTDSNGNYTTGNMYYQTTSGGALSLMTTTVSPAAAETDITAAKRGDTLYLLCTSKTEWENMTVTFKDSSGTAISGAAGITANYIGLKDSDHWWSISIPTGAASFTVTKDSNTTTAAEIYPLSQKLSRYKKDYTLGDMQYRLPAPAASSKPGLLYPIFTQDDEYTLEVGGKTISSSSGTALVDESAIANYAGASAVTTPATTGVSEPTSPYPVLYSTTTDNLSYSWTDGGGTNPNYNYVRFRDKDNWNNKYYNSVRQNLTAYFFGGSGNGVHVSIDHSESDNGTVYYFAIPNGNHTKVLFTNRWDGSNWNNDGNWSDSRQTCDIELIGDGHGYAYEPLSNDNYNSATPKKVNTVKIYDPTPSNSSSPLVDDTYFYAIGFYSPGQTNAVHVAYYNSNNEMIADYLNQGVAGYYLTDGTNWYQYNYINSTHLYKFRIPSDFSYAIVYNENNGGRSDETEKIYKNDIDSHRDDAVWYTAYNSGTTNKWNTTWLQMYNSSHEALVAPIYPVVQNISDVTHTAAYQPEDRYGFITSRDDYSTTLADPDNFIYISTTISDPYITFYDSNNSAIGGNNMATAGIKLKGVCGNSASPYKIRLPRNAKSFKLADGASGTLGSAVHLEETIYVKTDRTLTTSSDTSGITMTNYRHAGTTFNAVSTTNVTATTLRSGFTVSREAALSETSPKSDIDYVFFTNTDTTLTGTVYAYFYGGADGEFAHWPGIQAESSYTDNAGKTVYRFRIPKDTNGTYSKVIFNNGSAIDGTRKITQAVNATGGHNYTLNTASTAQYGTYDGTNAINAYAVSGTPKAAAGSAAYGSNRYIYIHNNGTQNLTNGVDAGTYKLDEMHVIFYDINNTPIGSADSGYIPDRLIVSNAVTDYYRMQVPNGAVYFQITNGTGKGTGSNYYSRQSEIKQITANGLYEFVSGKTNAADFITADSTVPTGNNATREAPKYLLTLKNEKKAELDDDVPETSTFDVKLAVVVTGTNGEQKYIKWLRQVGGEVDQAYLNHTNADVYVPANNAPLVTTVKVVKNGTYYWKEVVAPAGYELNENTFEFVKNESTTSTVTTTVTDKKISGKVILTKTVKEKVGTTNIGDPLAGAQFKLVKVNGNSEDTSLRFTLTTVEGKNTYSLSSSSASYNNIGYWLTTGSDGKLTIEGLSPGDYYLEEQTAPAGFVATDSNNVVNGTAQKKRVYFSIGDNTSLINLTCSDEMAPAYIKLYEHINEKLPAWGNPTFIFKITQTGYYKNDGTTEIENISNGKTMIVALTVDDDGKLTTDTVLGDDYNGWYQESTDEMEGESPQTREYQGMYHIDSEGRIRFEPGTYTITRVPVSRYEFVADTWKLEDDTTANIYTTNKHTETNQTMTGSEPAIQNVTIPQGKTALVHYYDKVAYYDKFSHVDEEINKFYTLDASKNNTTAKGIRVEFNGKVATSTSTATIYTNSTNNTTANSNKFNAWFINVDGTEREMTSAQKANLVIDVPSELNSDFSYNSTTHTLSIANTNNHANNVYTLTATYDNKFTTTFDLVFERTP